MTPAHSPLAPTAYARQESVALPPQSLQVSNRSLDRRIGKTGVPKITVRGTRKTCGSLLATHEVHPRVAMQILRHSKIALTMEIYTEVPSADTRAALKKLGRRLGT